MKKSPEDKALIVSKKKWLEDALDVFSENHLDLDYFDLTCDVVDRMARKRQVPFLTGRLEIWAASIIHAIGRINFLYDKSFDPYICMDDLVNYFKTSKRTISPKATQIQKMFDMYPFHPEFSTWHMLYKCSVVNIEPMSPF